MMVETKKVGGPNATRLSELGNVVSNGITCLKSQVGDSVNAVSKLDDLEKSSSVSMLALSDTKSSFEANTTDPTAEEVLNIVVTDSSAEGDAGEELTDISKVNAISDLSLFANTLVKNDAEVNKVTITDESLSLSYKTKAKFIGIFSSSLSAKTTVSAGGDLKVKYPWYGFLFSKKNKLTTENVKAEVLNTLGVKVDATDEEKTEALKMQNTIAMRAKLLVTLSNVMKNLNTVAEVETEGEVDTDASSEENKEVNVDSKSDLEVKI